MNFPGIWASTRDASHGVDAPYVADVNAAQLTLAALVRDALAQRSSLVLRLKVKQRRLLLIT